MLRKRSKRKFAERRFDRSIVEKLTEQDQYSQLNNSADESLPASEPVSSYSGLRASVLSENFSKVFASTKWDMISSEQSISSLVKLDLETPETTPVSWNFNP